VLNRNEVTLSHDKGTKEYASCFHDAFMFSREGTIFVVKKCTQEEKLVNLGAIFEIDRASSSRSVL